MAAAFIVDGVTEKKIVQAICRDSIVRMTNLNGKNVSVEAIAKMAHSLLNLFRGRHFPVFIIADREQRAIEALDMERQIKEALSKLGGDTKNVIVACPDRMIENWMLADSGLLRAAYGLDEGQSFEGANGKSVIRKIMKDKNFIYHETTVGVDTFCKIEPEAACRGSESFARFRAHAKPYCSWLRAEIDR